MSLFGGFFNQNIDYIYSVTRDGWGDVTIATEYSDVLCRWQESIGRIVSETEDVKEYKVEAWIDSPYTVEQDYEVKKGSRTYRVIKVIDSYDIFGKKDYTKLYLE